MSKTPKVVIVVTNCGLHTTKYAHNTRVLSSYVFRGCFFYPNQMFVCLFFIYMATIHLIAVWFSSRISLVKMKKLISVIRALI